MDLERTDSRMTNEMNVTDRPTPTASPHMQPPRKAPPGNVRHGLRGSTLPPGCKRLEWQASIYRRALEAAVAATGAVCDPVKAGAINRAYEYEMTRQLANRAAKLAATIPESLGFKERAAAAASSRDKAVAELGLTADPLAQLRKCYE